MDKDEIQVIFHKSINLLTNSIFNNNITWFMLTSNMYKPGMISEGKLLIVITDTKYKGFSSNHTNRSLQNLNTRFF